MAAVNLKSMDVDALLVLRADIEKQLASKRRDLEAQLSRLSLSGETGGRAVRNGKVGRPRKSHPLKGAKVAPKYRGPGGETWAGRGAQPRWLSAMLKQGSKLEDFAISKIASAGKGAAAKKSRRKRA
jgi:DNA-binding protein H-NS